MPPNLNQGSHSDRQFLKKEDTGFGKGYGMNVGGKMMTKPIVNIQISANFAVSDTSNLAEGNEVEHQRFGKGTVINMLDIGENRKAVIAFNQAGEKTLVLKFAKLMILN